jgi:hypothetical protein
VIVGGPCANTKLVKPLGDSIKAANITTIVAIVAPDLFIIK